jgi:phenylacetic acid degradation operon negative regulatory protein
MLQLMIAMSKIGDRRGTSDWKVVALDARSLALSVLLGSHPPSLPARALVALAELFEIAPGTMRTALSRLVAAGELALIDGRYHLAGHLLDRQRAQDAARTPPGPGWNGDWHVVLAADQQRDLAERRRFRATMVNHRFGELRPDTWLRPANLPAPPIDAAWIAVTGPLAGRDPLHVAGSLWDLPRLRDTCLTIRSELDQLDRALDWTDPASIPSILRTSAAAVRFLRSEPALPQALLPEGWPVVDLRRAYDDTERRFQHLLQSFLRH